MTSLAKLLKDPPPSCAFELSEAGVAFAKIGDQVQPSFEAFEEPLLSVSPVHDNVQNAEALQAKINQVAPSNGHRKRRAALILPDYAARVAVLDFDAFPSNPEEQIALVRFRMKKSVPFDVDTALLSYSAQPATNSKKIEVVVAIMAREIVTRYEAPFRALGILPGFVTTSALAMLNLIQPEGLRIAAKLTGRTLTAMVLDGSVLKLVRCVEMADDSQEEIEDVLHPTVAYIEDELATKPNRILLCGFGARSADLAREWEEHWDVRVEQLQSRLGMLGQNNAGLLGYLESAKG
ncbi:MAG TPA: hypothetical protein VKU01_17920 [Bryobacteraceae bacterium]|nr:hypothetical protein [Bryobacteraceae bacterium]